MTVFCFKVDPRQLNYGNELWERVRLHPRSQCLTSRCLGGVAEVRPCETGWFASSAGIS